MDSMMGEDFEEVIACRENPTWSPIASPVAKDEIKFPHFIVLMSHNYTEGDDDFLLRGEVLAILVMMITRMKHPPFEKHSIIPIVLLSFMNQEGRIIQAYHDGQNLILHKSKLHDFAQRTTAPFDLSVQYLASTPRGDTRRFLQRPTAAQQSTQRTQPTPQSTKETTKVTTETVVQPKHNQSDPVLPQSTEKPKSDVKSSTLPIRRRKSLGERSGSQAEPA